MEALSAFFALGTAWFFIFTAIWVILLFYWVEKDHVILSGFNILLYLLFLNFIVKQDIFDSIMQHPVRALLCVIGYALLGFLWSMVKWWLFVNEEGLRAKTKKVEFLKDILRGTARYNNKTEKDSMTGFIDKYKDSPISLNTQIPEGMIPVWERYGNIVKRPKVVDFKLKISQWILYWPVSAMWSLINDFLSRITQVIVIKFRTIYEAITNSAFKGINEGSN